MTKWVTLRFVLAVLLFALTLFIFVSIADEIVLEHENGFDTYIAHAIFSIESSVATRVFKAFTFFGSSTFLFPAYSVLALFFLLKKRWKPALDVTTIGVTSTSLLYLLKDIFKRQRPLNPLIKNVTGFSFPSGHSFSSFTFCGVIVYLVWQTKIKKAWKIAATIILFLFAATVAFSRVYLRVHYPSDVVAGFCLSIIWLTISFLILHKADEKIFKQTPSA